MIGIFKKLLFVLSRKEKQKLLLLIFFLLFAAGLEMLGIGLLLPVLMMFSDFESFINNSYINSLSKYLGYPDNQTLINLILLAVIVTFIIKNIIMFIVRYTQYRIVYGICHSLRTRLIKIYLIQEWGYHIQTNSSIILRNITHELQRVSSLIDTYVLIIAEFFVINGLLLIILLYTPIESIAMVVFLVMIIFTFSKIFPKRMQILGKMRTKIDGTLIQQIKEIFGAIKEISLLGQGSEFYKYLTVISKKESIMHAKLLNAQNIPNLVTETLIVSFVLGIMLFINDINNLASVVPIIGIIAVTGIRLKPSVSKILSSINIIHFQKDALEIIYSEYLLKNTKSIKIERVNEPVNQSNNQIVFKGISYTYPKSSSQAITNISFDLKVGSSLGIIGKSGGGKTTLVDLFLGLLLPTKGTIEVDDNNIHDNIRLWQDNIGYVPQNIYLIDDSIRQNIALGIPKSEINEESILKAISLSQMTNFIHSLPDGLDTIVGEYGVRFSGGQRQRIGIARALYHNPEILVFDEATSAVDNVTEKKLMNSIENLSNQKTVIIVAHRLNTVKNCDKIIMLDNGKVVDEGSWQDLAKDSDMFQSFTN